jgi:hypothetical protein
VGEHGQELVLAPVGVPQRLVGPDQLGGPLPDPEVELVAGPAQRLLGALALDGVAEGPLQQAGVQLLLDEEVRRPGPHGREVGPPLAVCGQEDQRGLAAQGDRLLQQFQPVARPEAVVEEVHVVPEAPDGVEALLVRPGPLQLERRPLALPE